MPKVKVPKKIAGVKVPKKLRKEAKQALKLADSNAVRDLALAGLKLAAENLLDRTKARRTTKAGREAVAEINLNALHLGDVLRAAAVEGARRFVEGFEEAQRAAASAAEAPAKPAAQPRRKKANGRAAAGR